MTCLHSLVPYWFSAGLSCLLMTLALAGPGSSETPDNYWVFVGTYTAKGGKGIYRLEMDLRTGKLSAPQLVAEADSPSFLAIHPNQRLLYAINEVGNFRGKPTGAVRAYSIDSQTGKLTALNQQSSGGGGPCYVVVDRAGKNVLVANYGSGSAAVLPIQENGHLGEATAFVQHKGSSVNPQRQQEPHAHSINLDPANHFAFVADLGLDKILVYRFDSARGSLTPNEPPAALVAPGSGPRHFTFHPKGKHAYAINEMANTVTVFDYDAEGGVLKTRQTISTLPPDWQGESWTAEVQCHPSGKFLYGSNRGHNSIAIFKIDSHGKLTSAGYQGKEIKTPRNFTIDPTGKFLLVANMDSNSIVVFHIDPDTGALGPTDIKVDVSMPVCLRMMPIPHY